MMNTFQRWSPLNFISFIISVMVPVGHHAFSKYWVFLKHLSKWIRTHAQRRKHVYYHACDMQTSTLNCNASDLSKVLLYTSRHYSDDITSAMAYQITDVSIVCSNVCSGADQRKHQSSVSLFLWGGTTGGFPSQRASNTEKVSIWWHRHGLLFQ